MHWTEEAKKINREELREQFNELFYKLCIATSPEYRHEYTDRQRDVIWQELNEIAQKIGDSKQ